MKFLLDTNVVSEILKPRAHPLVVGWLQQQPAEQLFLSVLSLGEVRKGIEKPGLDTQKRAHIVHWLEQQLPEWLGPNVLVVDAAIAERWGRLMAGAGRTLPTVDTLLAATALEHGLCLATRNTADFASLPGLELLNPWQL